jgi:hypothetical protein
MNWSLFWQLLVTAIVAFAGALLAHTLAAKRDRANKRREQRISFLIEAYRRIESAVNRPSDSSAAAALESAVADIQLFGNRKQVELVQTISPNLQNIRLRRPMLYSTNCAAIFALNSASIPFQIA